MTGGPLFRLTHNAGTLDDATLRDMLQAHMRYLDVGRLRLQGGCLQGGWADHAGLELGLLNRAGDPRRGELIEVLALFTEVVGGCNCHDDPVRYPASCRLTFRIDATGAVHLTGTDAA